MQESKRGWSVGTCITARTLATPRGSPVIRTRIPWPWPIVTGSASWVSILKETLDASKVPSPRGLQTGLKSAPSRLISRRKAPGSLAGLLTKRHTLSNEYPAC